MQTKRQYSSTLVWAAPVLLLGASAWVGCLGDAYDTAGYPAARDAASLATSDDLPSEAYYFVQRDLRKCAYPLCGGYFLTAANVDHTVCADGLVAEEGGCYVAALHAGGYQVSDGALVLGYFVEDAYGHFSIDALEVDDVFAPLREGTDDLWVNLLQDTGVVCVTTPCPTQRIAMVNTWLSWLGYGITFTDVSPAERPAVEEAFAAAYAEGGAIVGSHWHQLSADEWELSITNVYTRRDTMMSYCVSLERAGENSFVAWNTDSYGQALALVDGAEGTVNITGGTCVAQALLPCEAVDEAVCGTIDATGETSSYRNACELQRAVFAAAGDTGKATGEWREGTCAEPGGNIGEPCGGLLGLVCQDWLYCRYPVEAMCGAADQMGTCARAPVYCAPQDDPVCGCDGRDYPNACSAWQHQTSAASAGTCTEP